MLKIIYFNTSNVTIQRRCTAALSFPVLISIHLMLLFNFDAKIDNFDALEFQYI